jgi:hypothetical protein
MLAECQPVRAIVANPALSWAALAAVMEAGTITAGSTASQIKAARFTEREGDENYVVRPRFAVTDAEEDGWSRTSTSGHVLTGQLNVLGELDIPPGLSTEEQAKNDVRLKSLAIQAALLQLPREYPRLDIVDLKSQSGLVYPTENKGDWFQVVQFSLVYRGAI